jgi:carbamoyl-phosphate synthase large subunit
MPKDQSIKSVLIIGSGPIVIGQACEFDYAGSQASKSLREEGIEVTIINPNPATIMTDKVTADNIYLLPLEPKSIVKILEKHKIDACCPPWADRVLSISPSSARKWASGTGYNVRMIGVDVEAIEITEDREKFRKLMGRIGVAMAPQATAKSFLEGKEVAQEFGFPLCIRASTRLAVLVRA